MSTTKKKSPPKSVAKTQKTAKSPATKTSSDSSGQKFPAKKTSTAAKPVSGKAATKVSAKKIVSKKSLPTGKPPLLSVKKSTSAKTPAKATSAAKAPKSEKKVAAAKAPAKASAAVAKPEKKAAAPKASAKVTKPGKSAKTAPVEQTFAPVVAPKVTTKSVSKPPVMNHDVAVKTLTDHRSKHQQDAPVNKKQRRNSPIAYTFEDAEEYLKKHAGQKVNLYVPGQEEPKPVSKAAARAAAIDKPIENRQVTAVSVADLLGFNPFAKTAGDTTPEEELIPQKYRKYYRLLLELRDHVNEGLAAHTEEALAKTSKDDTGDVSAYSQHMADAGTDSFDRDFALSLVNNEQEALYEIAEAIDRMKDGTYGVCEITGEPIPHDRLVAVPFTRYSAEGQRQVEKNRRRGPRRSTGNPMMEMNEGSGFGSSSGGEDDGEES